MKSGVKMQVLTGGTNSLYGMNWLVKGVDRQREGLTAAFEGAPQGAPLDHRGPVAQVR